MADPRNFFSEKRDPPPYRDVRFDLPENIIRNKRDSRFYPGNEPAGARGITKELLQFIINQVNPIGFELDETNFFNSKKFEQFLHVDEKIFIGIPDHDNEIFANVHPGENYERLTSIDGGSNDFDLYHEDHHHDKRHHHHHHHHSPSYDNYEGDESALDVQCDCNSV